MQEKRLAKRRLGDNQTSIFGGKIMVNVKKFVSAKYLSAKNLGDIAGKTVVINTAFPDVINDEEKLIVRFVGIESPLVLNQTNLAILISEYGEDTDDWINNSVKINLVKVNYNGQMVDGIQLSPAKSKK